MTSGSQIYLDFNASTPGGDRLVGNGPLASCGASECCGAITRASLTKWQLKRVCSPAAESMVSEYSVLDKG